MAKRVTRVLVTLPGGIRPAVDSSDAEQLRYEADAHEPEHGVAVAGLDEGTPVLLADISFSRSRVSWHITFGAAAGETWEFARAQYDAAIRDLLALLGEEPVLISDQEWGAPPLTRVVPA